jgi:signal transduction histidine kinase
MPTRKDSCAQLLSLAVHEFRTPASVVSGYLRMLQRDDATPLNDRHRKMVDEAEKSCARLVALVAEMSEVSKLDAGLTTLGKAPLDLFAVIQELANGVHEAQERDVRFELRGEASGAAMMGDVARLRGAFSAVFRAILREQPAACTVVADRRIEAQAGERAAVIVVAEQSAVHAVYSSKPAPFDEKRGGLGLALPIARRIIQVHGGRLWAPASAAERGAAVISLPLRS